MVGTEEVIENWEVDDMMADGDKNNDYQIDFEGPLHLVFTSATAKSRPDTLSIVQSPTYR